MPQVFNAKVVDHHVLATKFHWYSFALESPLDFIAGQFLMLTVPGLAAKRCYSIASSPAQKDRVDLIIDIGPQGDGTLYLQSLHPGTTVNFMAPAGQFVIAENPAEKEIVLIATGCGLSAVRSMAFDLLENKQETRPITLHFGLRFTEDIFLKEEFESLSARHANFHFDLALSKPDESWTGCQGHITDCIKNHPRNHVESGYYMCGNQKMIEETIALLNSLNVPEANIHHERF